MQSTPTAPLNALPAAPPPERFAQQIEAMVLKKIATDTLALPTMSTVAAKCLEVLRQPEFAFKDAAAILDTEPVLAARILRVANSAAFAGGTKGSSLVQALARIGAKTARAMLVEASAARLYVSRNPQIATSHRKLWEHAVAVALLARDVSAITGGDDPDAAYLSGLLHDVGKPIVAGILLEAERQFTEAGRDWVQSAEWSAVVKSTHRKVGVALADKWGLPAEVRDCIRDCSEYAPATRGSVPNAVCFANALAKQAGYGGDDDGREDAEALVMIGRSMLGLDEAAVASLTSHLGPNLKGLVE